MERVTPFWFIDTPVADIKKLFNSVILKAALFSISREHQLVLADMHAKYFFMSYDKMSDNFSANFFTLKLNRSFFYLNLIKSSIKC